MFKFIILHLFLLDFTFLFYFLVIPAIGINVIATIAGYKSFISYIFYFIALITYLIKLFFPVYYIKKMKKRNNSSFISKFIKNMKNDIKFRAIILFIFYFVNFFLLILITNLTIYETALCSLLLSPLNSYIILLIHWNIIKKRKRVNW